MTVEGVMKTCFISLAAQSLAPTDIKSLSSSVTISADDSVTLNANLAKHR